MRRGINILFSLVLGIALLMVSGCVSPAKKAETKKPGIEFDGIYVNDQMGFSVEYPADKLTRKLPVKPPVLLNIEGPRKVPSLMALVIKQPESLPLENSGVMVVGMLKKFFPKSQRHKLLKQETVTLENGTAANYIEMKWKFNRTLSLVTVGTIAYKEGKAVIVIASNVPTGKTPISVLESWVKTLKFNR